MFFLQNGIRDNKLPILLLHSCSRYLEQVQIYFTDCFHFSQLTQQIAIFGFDSIDNDNFLIQNHIFLLFKLHIYSARKYGFLSFNNFLNEISKIENLEKRVAPNN